MRIVHVVRQFHAGVGGFDSVTPGRLSVAAAGSVDFSVVLAEARGARMRLKPCR
jgi:hypothetical protein